MQEPVVLAEFHAHVFLSDVESQGASKEVYSARWRPATSGDILLCKDHTGAGWEGEFNKVALMGRRSLC